MVLKDLGTHYKSKVKGHSIMHNIEFWTQCYLKIMKILEHKMTQLDFKMGQRWIEKKLQDTYRRTNQFICWMIWLKDSR